MNRFNSAGLALLILFMSFTHTENSSSPPVGRIDKSAMLHVPASIGELLDKITILEIKIQRISDPKKLDNVLNEWRELMATLETHLTLDPQLSQLKEKLLTINEQMWDIEDDIRAKEAAQLFDEEFIELARNIYFTNDRRCAVKRTINELTGSALIEEKEYTKY